MEVDHEDPVLWEGMKMAESSIDIDEENGDSNDADGAIYSYSMLDTFRKCRYSFYKRYIMKERPPLQGIEAFMGTTVHGAIQEIYKQKKKRNVTPTKEEILKFYDTRWGAEYTAMRSKGIKVISVRGPNGMKMQVESNPETLAESKRRGRVMVEVYYDKNHPFSEVSDIKIERVFIFELNGRKIKAKIDMLGYNGHIKLFEFKTGKYLDLKKWGEQISVYLLAVRKYAGEEAVIEPVVYHLSTAEKHNMSHLNSPKNIEDTEMQLMASIRDIELLTQNWTQKDCTKYPPATETFLCPWCQFYNDCPQWEHLFNSRQTRIST